jgi:sigma-B regulation protein RsbU (phosphoserine phosphatase)
VDSALERIDGGTWGYCERCHDTVEGDRLLSDPLVRVCLGCLTEPERRALERDLELAASIQAALLPARRVRHDGWEVAYRYLPLGPVSGDHCDVLLPRDGEAPAHFVLGDVSGKGVAAALLMSHLQAALRALAGMRLPLESMVERVNHLLCESTTASSYATAVIGRLGRAGSIELCNAAHCSPLLVRRDGTSAIPPTGLPLGMMNEASFGLHRFELEPGETLFVYTDGLSEARNGADEMLGESSVAEMVAALGQLDVDALLDGCLARAAALRGASPRTDDLTVMAVRRVA